MLKFLRLTINFSRVIPHLLQGMHILLLLKIHQIRSHIQILLFSNIFHIHFILPSLYHPFQMSGDNLLLMSNGECHRVIFKQTINMVYGEEEILHVLVHPMGKKVIFGHHLKDHQ